MKVGINSCACGRHKAETARICEVCDARRVESIRAVHERPRASVGVVSYQPTERQIIASINANAARQRRARKAPIAWDRVAVLLMIPFLAVVFVLGLASVVGIVRSALGAGQ
jgi:hypothetical protein